MVSPLLASWQAKNHYRSSGDVVYGVYRSCGFSASEDDSGLLFVFMLTPRDNDAFDDLEDSLVREGGEIARGQVGDVEGYLAIFFDQQTSGGITQRTMDSLMDFVAEQARSCGFRVPSTCVKCGARASKRSFVDGIVQPLCTECSAQNRRERQSPPRPTPVPAPAAPRNMPQDDARYSQQYAPIVADDSKYDASYDEYTGMMPAHSNYKSMNQLGGDNGMNDMSYAPFDTGDDPAPLPDNGGSGNSYARYPDNAYRSKAPASPIRFDEGQDDYNDIMGDDGSGSAVFSETHIEGSAAKGILGAVLGSLAGVIPYIFIAMVVKFPMAALCFPAGILAVMFYVMLQGRKSVTFGMAVCAAVSSVISFLTTLLCMGVFYMEQTRTFTQALQYLLSENSQFLVFNTVLSILGAAFGALFMIVRMSKYVEE